MKNMRCIVTIGMLISMTGVRADAGIHQKGDVTSIRKGAPDSGQRKGSEQQRDKIVDMRKQDGADVSRAGQAGRVFFHGVVIPMGIPAVVAVLTSRMGCKEAVINSLTLSSIPLSAMGISPYMRKNFTFFRLSDREQYASALVATGITMSCIFVLSQSS